MEGVGHEKGQICGCGRGSGGLSGPSASAERAAGQTSGAPAGGGAAAAASLQPQDRGGEERNSEAVRQYEAGLESSYKEQCALALEDKKTVLRRIMNEKENAENINRRH